MSVLYEPFNIRAVATGGSDGNVGFEVEVGVGMNVSFNGHVPGNPKGEANYDLVADLSQQQDIIMVTNSWNTKGPNETELEVQLFQGGILKGKGSAIYQ